MQASPPCRTNPLRASAIGVPITLRDRIGRGTGASSTAGDRGGVYVRLRCALPGPRRQGRRGISPRRVRADALVHRPLNWCLGGRSYWHARRGRRPDRSRTACSIPTTSRSTSSRYNRPRDDLTVGDRKERHPAHLEGPPVAAGARPMPFGPGRVTVLDRPADLGAEVGDPREHGLPVGEHLGSPGESPARMRWRRW